MVNSFYQPRCLVVGDGGVGAGSSEVCTFSCPQYATLNSVYYYSKLTRYYRNVNAYAASN